MGNASGRSPSPWWWLLVLPACPLIGWAVAELPAQAPRQPAPQPVLQLGAGTQPVAAGATRAEPPAGDTPQEEYSQWTSFENAVAESRRSGKPVMIDFSADWCGPCQRLKREVFDDPGNGHVVQTTVIPVSIVDRVQERGSNPPDVEDLQRRYQVQAFPTLVVFSPASGRSLQTRGFADAERTLAWIKSAAHSVR